MTKIIVSAVLILALGGCEAVYAWDTMQLRSVQKQAAQKLMTDCDAGDREACAYIAGKSHSR